MYKFAKEKSIKKFIKERNLLILKYIYFEYIYFFSFFNIKSHCNYFLTYKFFKISIFKIEFLLKIIYIYIYNFAICNLWNLIFGVSAKSFLIIKNIVWINILVYFMINYFKSNVNISPKLSYYMSCYAYITENLQTILFEHWIIWRSL